MGIVGVAIVAALVGFGAKALGKANRKTDWDHKWLGSTMGHQSGYAMSKIGDSGKMTLLDPLQGAYGKYPTIAADGEPITYNFPPVAIATVQWTGVDEKKKLAIGKIVSVDSIELMEKPSARKPLVGDTVLFQ